MYEDRNYYTILKDACGHISDDIQKNEGSLTYNALSALAYQIEQLYIEAKYIMDQGYGDTADYEHLKMLAAPRVRPIEPSCAVVKGVFDVEVPIGARFNLAGYNYVVTGAIELHTYSLQCEEMGSGPNGLRGPMTAITYVDGLNSAEITDLITPGRDEETYKSFYMRYLESFQSDGFGGNVTAYKMYMNQLDGVGGSKVFPVWNGSGTVKVAVIGADWRAASDYLIGQIQEEVCPVAGKGYGFAPIDHDVTIVPAEEIQVSVSTSITFSNGYSWAVTGPEIQEAVDNYFLSLRQSWGNGGEDDFLIVYIARLESAILDVRGVLDVQGTTLNSQGNNLVLTPAQIPILEAVINV